jgi:hypothetical protein
MHGATDPGSNGISRDIRRWGCIAAAHDPDQSEST